MKGGEGEAQGAAGEAGGDYGSGGWCREYDCKAGNFNNHLDHIT